SRPDWVFDIDALTRTMNCEPIVAEKEDNVYITNNVNTVSSTVNATGTNEDNELLFNLNMPDLKGVSIFNFSKDDEDDGTMADMNNLDTTIQSYKIGEISDIEERDVNDFKESFCGFLEGKKEEKDEWFFGQGWGSGNMKETMVSDTLNVEAKSTTSIGDGNVVTSVGSVELINASLDGSKENGKSYLIQAVADTKVNFRSLDTNKPINVKADVKIPKASVLEVYSRFRFNFASIEGMNEVLENGPWFIRYVPIILKKWMPNANLLKEDKNSVPIWVKLIDPTSIDLVP
nr:hypothetical protein [Tanacetum cinerariifolium]